MGSLFRFFFKYPAFVFHQGDFTFAASRTATLGLLGLAVLGAVAIVTYRGVTTDGPARDRFVLVALRLALIAVLIGGLTSLRFGSAPEHIEVPAHARAGDLLLHKCDYATEKGDYSADCGDEHHGAGSKLECGVEQWRRISADHRTQRERDQRGSWCANHRGCCGNRNAHDVYDSGRADRE